MGKRLPQFLFVFVILFFVMYPQAPAYCAEDRVYGRVLKNDVLLYKDDSMSEENVYFTLPYSYYVVILNPDGEDDCYQVEYQEYSGGYSKIIGYVRKEDLTVWEDPSEPLYPSILATVKQVGHMYSRPDSSSEKQIMISHDQKLRLYGSFYSEADDMVYYFALFSSRYAGYVPATILEIDHPGNHPDPIPTPPPPSHPPTDPQNSGNPQNPGDPSQKDDSLLQIILIAAICVPALIIVYLMFKPSRRVKYNFRTYDDEDFE